MNNKIVVYTCITQDYDNLLEPVFVDKDVDYICFTDNSELLKQNYTKNTWKILDIPEDILSMTEDKVKQQRLVKILAHKVLPEGYSLSIYIDANIRITFYITDFLKKYLYSRRNNDFILVRKHPTRNCIYDEQKAVVRLGKDTFENTRPQMMKYIQEGYPAQYGLTENNILVRYHHDKRCLDLMNCWADEIIQYSHRDQLSFNYALWKTGLKNHGVRIIDMPIHNSKWFRYYKHKYMMIEDSTDDKPSDDGQEDFDFIVAFTTHKKRFLRLVETDCKSLETIINQKTDYKYKVVLTLYKEDYDLLPEKLKNFIEKNNIEVIVAEQNLKVHLKWYYAVQKYGDKYPVILVDDDVYYQNFLFDTLYKSHLKHNDCIVASRCHIIETDSENIVLPYSVWKKYEIIKKFNMTFDERKLFATGVGGVLYPPKSIDFNLIKIDEMMSLAGTNDDIYLKCITSKSGVRTVMLPPDRVYYSLCEKISQDPDSALSLRDNKVNNDLFIDNLLKNIFTAVNAVSPRSSLMESHLLNLTYILDDCYIEPMITSINSVIKNKKPETVIKIFIVLNNISAKNKEILNKFINSVKKENEIEFTTIDGVPFSKRFNLDQIITNIKHVPPSTACLKFFLPDILKPYNLKRCLYLDSDTIILNDLTEIFNVSLGHNNILGAVKDYNVCKRCHSRKNFMFIISKNKGYFNSGVILFDLDKLYKTDEMFSQNLLKYRLDEINFFTDQDAFNAVYGHKTKFLNPKFNYLSNLISVEDKNDIAEFYGVTQDEINITDKDSLKKNVVVFHLAGGLKPYESMNATTSVYLDYRCFHELTV